MKWYAWPPRHFEVGCLASEECFDSVELLPWIIFQPINKAKTMWSSWRQVVGLLGRRYNLALSDQVSFASIKFDVKKAIEWSNYWCVG